jgi:hypothetical protein
MSRTGFVVAAALCLPSLSAGQGLLLGQDQSDLAAVEFWHPFFEGDDPDLPSGAVYTTVRKHAGKAILVFGLPFGVREAFGETKVANGNFYFGVETRAPAEGWFAEVGASIPIAPDPDEGGEIGYFADIERFEGFFNEVGTVTAAANYRSVDEQGRGVRVRLSPDVWLPSRGDLELFADYGAFVFYETPRGRVMAGLCGHSLLTQGNVSFEERTMLGFEAAAGVNLGRFRPGVVFRYPINDSFFNAGLDSVMGVTLEVGLTSPER